MRTVAAVLLLILLQTLSTATASAETVSLADARRLARVEARYDAAVQVYRELVQSDDAAERAVVAAELADLYERLGDISAAVAMYEQAVAEGEWSKEALRRLDLRLQRCRRQRPSVVKFPVSVEARTDVRQIEAMLEAKQWAAALTAIDSLLDRFGDTFLEQGQGQYVNVWAWVRETLDSLPPEGQTAIAAHYDQAWLAALADGSGQAVTDFIKAHPASVAAPEAWTVLGEVLADQGNVRRARGLKRRRDLNGSDARTTSDEGSGAINHVTIDWDTLHSKSRHVMEVPWNCDGDAVGVAGQGGLLFVYADYEVTAYNIFKTSWRWRYRPTEPADRTDVQREIFYRRNRPKYKWAGGLDAPSIIACQAGVIVTEMYYRDEPERVWSIMTCLDPDKGTVKWRLDATGAFYRLRVCSDPVYTGGLVVFVANTCGEYPEFWLCAVDGGDGRLVWKERMAAGARPTQCIGRGMLYAARSGPTLWADDGGIIYYATHMGAIVAVDRDLGKPLWAVSYPRVPRFGPLVSAPLAMLQRRTEPIYVTNSRLILLPRDLDGLLVVDRHAGQIERTIRSFDLVSLVDVDEQRAIVTTVSGDLRAYDLNTGKTIWSCPTCRAPSAIEGSKTSQTAEASPSPVRALLSGQSILATTRDELLEIHPVTGSVTHRGDLREAMTLRQAHTNGQWCAIRPGRIEWFGGPRQRAAGKPAEVAVARQPRDDMKTGWRHEAFFPGREIEARLTGPTEHPNLIVRDRQGLSNFALADYVRQRWYPLNGIEGVWAASAPNDAAVKHVVVWSNDLEKVTIADATKGKILATGCVDGVSPIRSLHAVNDTVMVQGTSTLAGARVNDRVRLARLWYHDFSPCVFGPVVAGDPLTSIVVQPGGGEMARLLRMDSHTGTIVETFVIAVPRPKDVKGDDDDRADRFPVRRLMYEQDDLQHRNGRLIVETDGQQLELSTTPVRLLDRQGDDKLIVEMHEYLGVIELSSGRVTIMSPREVRRKKIDGTPNEQLLMRWRAAHLRWDRPFEPRFWFADGTLRYVRERLDAQAGYATPGREYLVDDAGREIALGKIRPERIDVVGDRAIVTSRAGVLILSKGPAGHPDARIRSGKVVADLFDPLGVTVSDPAGLVLDGDLSDWPSGGFEEMDLATHAWPPVWREDKHRWLKAGFQWAMDDEAVWLAVRVEDTVLASPSAAESVTGDCVTACLYGRRYGDQKPMYWRPPLPVFVTMQLADGVPIAHVRSPREVPTYAIPVGHEWSFGQWMQRRYGHEPVMSDAVVVAARRVAKATLYELRIDRSFFAKGEPHKFDLRVADDDGKGVRAYLSWAGTIGDAECLPFARLIRKKAGTRLNK